MMNKRKKKNGTAPRSARHEPLSGFYTPFRDLDQHLGTNISNEPGHPDKPQFFEEKIPSSDNSSDNDEALFLQAMETVSPLPARKKEKVPARPPVKEAPRFHAIEEMEAFTELVDLVAGEGPFELSYSDEYVDGAVVGISPEVMKKLRSGGFSYQDHLDLHGLTRREAKTETIEFIMKSFAARRRCVLIIPGRGLNSKDKEPVLKNSLVAWLTHSPLKRMVLAFASARSYDGGWGAFYVLLRKNEGKTPIITPAR